jgi:hypothetical protein
MKSTNADCADLSVETATYSYGHSKMPTSGVGRLLKRLIAGGQQREWCSCCAAMQPRPGQIHSQLCRECGVQQAKQTLKRCTSCKLRVQAVQHTLHNQTERVQAVQCTLHNLTLHTASQNTGAQVDQAVTADFCTAVTSPGSIMQCCACNKATTCPEIPCTKTVNLTMLYKPHHSSGDPTHGPNDTIAAQLL